MELCLKQLVRKILTIPRNVDAQVAAGKAVGREQPGPTAVRASHPGTQPTHPPHSQVSEKSGILHFIRDVTGKETASAPFLMEMTPHVHQKKPVNMMNKVSPEEETVGSASTRDSSYEPQSIGVLFWGENLKHVIIFFCL